MFRWLALAVFVAAVGLSGALRRRARREESISRGAESPGLIAGRVLVGAPLFGAVIAYLVNPGWMAWARLDLPAWARWTGVALGVLVVPAIGWVLTTLGENVSETILTKRRHRLVTTGPYRWIRHPLYTAGIALFLSLGLMAANGFVLVWTMIALLAVRRFVIPAEEAHLEAKFGAEYRRYRAGAGRLLPRLWGTRDRPR